MDPQIVGTSYHWGYVALSFAFAFAFLGSLVALVSATRIRQPDGRTSVGNTLAAGLALGGIGVWSMHFIGILALQLDAGTSYSLAETGASLVAAVAASSLALGHVARAPRRHGRLLGAGFLLGMGVVAMHYLGMHGRRSTARSAGTSGWWASRPSSPSSPRPPPSGWPSIPAAGRRAWPPAW